MMFMKKFILLIILASLNSAHALQLTVIGPCSATPLLDVQSSTAPTNLGDLTVSVLTKYQIPFHGDRTGIASIANSPVGDAALEVLPDHSFRAYGWCVSVDNVEPQLTPNNVRIDSSVQSVKWFYASTRNLNGNWLEYCAPAYITHSLSLCR
jgi:hypothetical protein